MSLINDALRKAQVHATIPATPATIPATPTAIALPSPHPVEEGTCRDAGLGAGHVAAIVGALVLTTLAGTALVASWQSRRESANAMLSRAAPVKHASGALLLHTRQALDLAAEMVETSSARTRFPTTAALTPEDTAPRPSTPKPGNTSPARTSSDGPNQALGTDQPPADSAGGVANSVTTIAALEATPPAVAGPDTSSASTATDMVTDAEPVSITPAPADMARTFAVTGIMGGGARTVAIVNRRVVHVGDAIGNALVNEIRGDSVIVEIDGRQYEVPMQVPRR